MEIQKFVSEYITITGETLEQSKDRFAFEPRVEVRPSNYGRGVFACDNVRKGDVLTYYPAHYLTFNHMPNIMLTNPDLTKGDKLDKDYMYTSLGNDFSIVGHPELCNNPYMLGHLINDPCDEVWKREGETFGKWYSRYMIKSKMGSNCRFTENGIVAMIATRDIKKDEEIYVMYDVDYWGHRNDFFDKCCPLEIFFRLEKELGLAKLKFLLSLKEGK